jgi:hypothetical protein
MSNSHTITAGSSSTNFQLIFNNALKVYEKRTKNDLLAHPLATELQDCNSPAKILAVLHQQVQGPDQSLNSDDRWTKWLDPTVNVLYMLSETLGEGISLVSLKTRTHLRSAVSSLLGRYSHLERWYLPGLGFSFQYESFLMKCAGYLNTNCASLRQQRIFGKATKH